MRRSRALALAAALMSVVALLIAAPAGSGPSAQDRCVRGEWKMSNSASNALLQSLAPNPNMRVTQGVITAAFPRNDTMRYGSTYFVLELSAGDMVLEGTATFITEAPWSTRNGRLVLGRGRSELVISKLKATKDGQTHTVPGGPPITRRTPAGATPYTCNRTTLRWRVPIGETQTLFRRAG